MTVSSRPLAERISNGSAHGSCQISLAEFKSLYSDVLRMAQVNHTPFDTYILLLTEQAIVKFSTATKFVLIIETGHSPRKKDFEFILDPKYSGNISPIPARAFIWTEFKQNWWIIIPVFLLLFITLSFDEDLSSLQTINQMLVEANALFIGIFILFTISQNRDLLMSKELIKQGFTHRLIQNDRYIANMSIMSLILAFFSESLIGIASKGSVQVPGVNLHLNVRFLSIFLTIVAFILLFNCFLAVSRYYLRVLRVAVEGKMYQEVLGESEQD